MEVIVGYELNIVADSVMQLPLARGSATHEDAIAPIIEHLIDVRCRRRSFFPPSLFADPAWEILLAVTLAEARHYRLTVSKLCDLVDVPATTALRWITTLTEAGLLLRYDDTTDKRRKFIEPSAAAYARMVEYCSSFKAEIRLAA
jgi:hypothetical protein